MAEVKKTLVILTPGFAADEADTTCLPFLQTHILAINKNFPDLEIIVLAFQYPYAKGTHVWHGNEVIDFSGKERAKIHRLLIWRHVWKKLRKLNGEKNIISILSLWCTECALVGSYFSKAHGLKHFTWLCGQDAKRGNKYVKFVRPKAGELIAMSDFLKREFYKNYGIMPAYMIPLGAAPDQFASIHPERDIDVLGAGSLIPLKQYDIFVKVIHELKNNLPSLNSIICGKGPEEDKIKGLITNYQLQGNVTLAGEIPHSGVLQLMQRTKIFLHPSNYEGLGTVCIEALYAGAHVISFTRPLDEEIPHWHHVDNEAEMTEKALELLKDPATKYESVCPYSAGDIANTMMELFNR